MSQSTDLVRCTNCWEGFEWEARQRVIGVLNVLAVAPKDKSLKAGF